MTAKDVAREYAHNEFRKRYPEIYFSQAEEDSWCEGFVAGQEQKAKEILSKLESLCDTCGGSGDVVLELHDYLRRQTSEAKE